LPAGLWQAAGMTSFDPEWLVEFEVDAIVSD
jgi:hypothetical protein